MVTEYCSVCGNMLRNEQTHKAFITYKCEHCRRQLRLLDEIEKRFPILVKVMYEELKL